LGPAGRASQGSVSLEFGKISNLKKGIYHILIPKIRNYLLLLLSFILNALGRPLKIKFEGFTMTVSISLAM
jgi:hypothetical protein